MESARIQGFCWDESHDSEVKLLLDETAYLTLALRYKELYQGESGCGGAGSEDVPFDLAGHLNEIDTGKIDADYMNTRFDKYLKLLQTGAGDAGDDALKSAVDELHKSFASLSQDEQKYANLFLNDVQRGDVNPEQGKTLRDYITQYQANAKNTQVMRLVEVLAVDEDKLNALLSTRTTESNINEYGRFDALKDTVDKAKAKAYFEARDGESLPMFKLNIAIDGLLSAFVLSGGFEL